MQQPNTLGTMFDILAEAMKPHTKLIELAAIWLNKPLKGYGEGLNIRRLAKDDIVCVDMDILENCFLQDFHENLPKYKVIKCIGTIDSSILKMELENLTTQEPITINI